MDAILAGYCCFPPFLIYLEGLNSILHALYESFNNTSDYWTSHVQDLLDRQELMNQIAQGCQVWYCVGHLMRGK